MKKILFFYFFFLAFNLSAQNIRYLNRVFSQTTKTANITYATAPSVSAPYLSESFTSNTALKMDIFQPTGDVVTERPVILLIHSGGFFNGTKDVDDMQWICDSFARRGYVTCSIDYRLGFNPLSSNAAERAVYRGLQDAASAIRYLKEFRTTYKIDTTHIFAWGSSAGGFTALNLAFLDDSERPASTFNTPNLGCINCSGNAYIHNSKVKAVANCWGAIGNTTWINANNNVPTILFHGNNDGTVPYNQGSPFGLGTLPTTYGSLPIDARLTNQGILHEFYTGINKPHEYWGTSNGTFNNPPTADYLDIIQKTALFFYGRLPVPPVTIALSYVTNTTCFGGNNGSAKVTASGGGNFPTTYAWSNGQTTQTATNLSAGIYTCTATCGTQNATIQVVVNQPLAINIAFFNQQNITCAGNGTATAFASNALGNINYVWSNGQIGTSLTTAIPNTYTVTATDANACKSIGSVSISSNNTLPSVNIQSSTNQLNCTNTTAVLSNSSTGNYTYLWTSGTTNATYSTASSGNYALTITDNTNGCKASNSFYLSENKTKPIADSGIDKVLSCTSSYATIGTAPIVGMNYKWSNAAMTAMTSIQTKGIYTLTVTNPQNGCTNTDGVTVIADSIAPIIAPILPETVNCFTPTVILTASATGQNLTYKWSLPNGNTPSITISKGGNYIVSVTDGTNGCFSTKTISVTEDKVLPTLQIQGDTAFCAGKSTVLTASGTTANYTWNNGQTTANLLVSIAGNYSVTATGSNGCVENKSKFVSLKPLPNVQIISPSILCENTALLLVATPNLVSYQWNFPTGNNSNVQNITQAGQYSVTATDAKGCTNSADKIVVIEKNPIVAATDVKACEGQNTILSANVSNAVSSTYEWKNTNNFVANTQNTVLQNVTVSNAGKYFVTATSPLGCIGKDTLDLSISPKMNIELIANVACDNSTKVVSTISGGIAPLSYAWNLSNSTANSIDITAPASVILKVQDAYACTATNTPILNVKANTPMIFTNKITPSTGKDGAIELSVTNSVAPYIYLWSNNETTSNITNLKAGKYCVTVTDAATCIKSECFDVNSIVVSVEENERSADIRIFPNPINDILNIITQNNVFLTKIELFDLKGTLLNVFSKETKQINMAGFASGIYLLKLNTASGFVLKKVVKI
jgi:poly(3-hydroxybutyrate) depolymerase